jgi:hypothetical protein
MPEIFRLKLRRPVATYGGSVSEVTLQEPSGGLYLRLGDPIRRVYEIADDGQTRRLEQIIRRDVVRQYISELSEIKDPTHVDQLHPRDIDRLTAVLIRYFRFEDEADGEGAEPAGSPPSGN